MPVHLSYKTPTRLLTPASGFLTGYSHTLNPYTGCAFACTYCYVREMPVAKFRGEPWGTWVDVKEQAAELLAKELRRERRKGPVSIFMSSATDPYQPIEYRLQLTRSLLAVMAGDDAWLPEGAMDIRPEFLLVQTRSPLVLRDIDWLQRIGSRVRVSVTLETDLEAVRRTFTPAAPPVHARLRVLRTLAEAGLDVQAAVSPVLPSSERFAETLAATGIRRVVVDDYFMGDGSRGRRSARLGLQPLYARLGCEEWYDPRAYRRVLDSLRRYFPEEGLFVSQAGFLP